MYENKDNFKKQRFMTAHTYCRADGLKKKFYLYQGCQLSCSWGVTHAFTVSLMLSRCPNNSHTKPDELAIVLRLVTYEYRLSKYSLIAYLSVDRRAAQTHSQQVVANHSTIGRKLQPTKK